jgi:hypothetical protein
MRWAAHRVDERALHVRVLPRGVVERLRRLLQPLARELGAVLAHLERDVFLRDLAAELLLLHTPPTLQVPAETQMWVAYGTAVLTKNG